MIWGYQYFLGDLHFVFFSSLNAHWSLNKFPSFLDDLSHIGSTEQPPMAPLRPGHQRHQQTSARLNMLSWFIDWCVESCNDVNNTDTIITIIIIIIIIIFIFIFRLLKSFRMPFLANNFFYDLFMI